MMRRVESDASVCCVIDCTWACHAVSLPGLTDNLSWRRRILETSVFSDPVLSARGNTATGRNSITLQQTRPACKVRATLPASLSGTRPPNSPIIGYATEGTLLIMAAYKRQKTICNHVYINY